MASERGKATITALQKGVELLARREHSTAELTDKLLAKGYEEFEVFAAIEKLSERDYLSDQRFCEQFVAMRIRQGKGPLKINNDLRVKGVDSSVIQGELANFDVEYWRQLALEVYEKKFGQAMPDDAKATAKWQRFLASRGFEYQHFPSRDDWAVI